MKSKLKLTIIIGLLSGFSTTILAEIPPISYCEQIPAQPHAWNETEAKATLTGIPKDCQKIWVAYAIDGSWASWYEVSFSYTPGNISATTSTIIPSGPYWEAKAPEWPGGAASYKKPGFVAFCLWSKYNTDPKNQDCTFIITPSNYDCASGTCVITTPTYCDNFRACLFEDKKTIKMSGLNNYTSGNWFAYTDDDYASYADFTTSLALKQDTVTIDFSQITYTSGTKKGLHIETPLTGELSMMADSNGPGKCTADNAGGNNRNGIDITTAPVCKADAINVVVATSVAISPNPATPSETITIKGQYASDAKVSIISASGAMVGSVTPSVGAEGMAVSLSGLNLQAGIYFVRIESGEKVFSGKLCVK